ncbi:HAD family hydrolase [Mycoplasma sp. P36-A1]|uniref:HAD family hydrolase n=1 Tax=Mycoplasma sp. P36-A1 TaxID=3252900 RepID=UPI003C2CB5DA
MNNNLVFVFDFDGTIVDSMPFWNNLVSDYLNEKAIAYQINYLYDGLDDTTTKAVCKWLNTKYLPHISNEAIELDLRNKMNDFYSNKVTLKPDMIEILEYLKQKQIPMIILSATETQYLNKALKHLNLEHYFEAVYSEKDFGLSKNNEHLYKEFINKANLNDKYIYLIDDNYKVVKACQNTNIKTIGIYDNTHSKKQYEKLNTHADTCFINNKALLNYIKTIV